jgi:hypothetical protein
VALQHRPGVIFLHQFNEFTGQQDGHGLGPKHDIYLDTYSVELSDDIEPVSLTAPGYRGDGGYGFYYLNLTRALMDLYRGKADDCTLLAVSSPERYALVTGEALHVAWSTIGAPADHYTIAIDGLPVQQNVTSTSVEVPVAGIAQGPHRLTVIAGNAITRYPLSWTELDTPMGTPMRVEVDVPFVIV